MQSQITKNVTGYMQMILKLPGPASLHLSDASSENEL